VLDLFGRHEIMQDNDTVATYVAITDRHEEVLLHLLEDFEPAFEQLCLLNVGSVRTTHTQDLHVFEIKRLLLLGYNHINQGVGQQNGVEIGQV